MKKNSGFTLAEMVIAMGIVGTLMGAAILALKPFDKNIKYLVSSTYYSLDRALYNSMRYWVHNDRNHRDPFIIRFNTAEDGGERLCNALVEYINTTDADCDSNKLVSDIAGDDEFTANNVQFTATNGVRFWISKRLPEENPGNSLPSFFLIFADTNGDKKPNSVRYTAGGNDPDIFVFAALNNGRICPIGSLEVNQRFLTTRILFRDTSQQVRNSYERYSSPSQEYAVSQAEAWGYYVSDSNRPAGAEGTDDDFMEEAPLSYNGYIKSHISSDSNIYSFLDGSSMAAYVSANLNSSLKVREGRPSENEDGLDCMWRSEDNCKVVIDKYRY